MTGPTPGTAGVNDTFDVSGATPGETVRIIGGTQAGSNGVPGCPGLMIDIGRSKTFGTAVADGSGDASVTVPIPAGASGRTFRFQGVEVANCRVSNLVVFSFP